MARMTGFIFQDKYLVRLEKLSDQEVGRLVRALATYHASGETQELKGRECGYYDFIKADIDEIENRYSARCETNRNNRQQSSTNVNEREETATKDPKIKIKEKDKDKDNTKREPPISPLFDRFWAEYPKKQGKQDAIKAFAKLNPDEGLLERMISAIRVWRDSAQWRENGGQYIPHPATWLNGKRWEDEAPKVVPLAKVSAQQYTQRSYTEAELEDRIESL